MFQNCNNLVKLVSKMLDLTNIELGKMEFHVEICHIKNLIANVYTEYSISAQKKGITFELDIPPEDILLRTDPVRFHQILVNLCDNAVKFTEK